MIDKHDQTLADRLQNEERLDLRDLERLHELINKADPRKFVDVGKFVMFAAGSMPSLVYECIRLTIANERLRQQLRDAVAQFNQERQDMAEKITFAIPEGTPPAKCRGCARTVFWIKTAAGKSMPVDADGQSHFATCPKASQFRKGK